MKSLGLICLFVAAYLSPAAYAQTESVANPLPAWNFSAEFSALHALNSQFDSHGTTTAYGWRGTAAQYPYANRPWLGGSAQIGGYYDTAATPSSLVSSAATGSTHLYTFLVGPSIRVTSRHVQPFAAALVGVVSGGNVTSAAKVGTLPMTGVTTPASLRFATGLGGGVDFPLSSRLVVRAHSDWLGALTSGNTTDFLQSSGGLVYRFW